MMTMLIAIFVGLPVLVTLLTYTLFCYEETNRTGQPLPPLLRLASRTAVKSAISEALIIALHPLGLWPGLWRSPAAGSTPVVILVHGLFHNPSAWTLFRRWLHAHGLAAACFHYPSWGSRDFARTVAALRTYVETLRAEHPERDIHLVGHSLGGLLLRSAAADLAALPNIKSLTTLGTPFHGSKLAPFALHSLGRFIWHESPTVQSVAALPFPEKIQGLALWSRADNMVLPNSALRCDLPGWENQETTEVSHIAMLHSPEIFREVLAAITRAAR